MPNADGTAIQTVLARAAQAWLNSLDDRQRAAARLPFDTVRRTDWHYVPRRRPGLPLEDMDGKQRRLCWALVETALSESGGRQAQDVVLLEGILGDLTGNRRFRDPDNYALILFGDPSDPRDPTNPTGPWGWRFEGHHLSLTFTVSPGHGVAVTPAFFGANPAEVPGRHSHHAGLRVLADEQDRGFALWHLLNATEQSVARIAAGSLGDIVAGPGRETSLRAPTGLPAASMSDPSRAALVALLETYIGRLTPTLAEAARAKMRNAGIEQLHFAWAGAEQPRQPHYYRVHGPVTLIEYDNTQNGANHIHTVWHDPTDLFGHDLLRAHHEQGHGRSSA